MEFYGVGELVFSALFHTRYFIPIFLPLWPDRTPPFSGGFLQDHALQKLFDVLFC